MMAVARMLHYTEAQRTDERCSVCANVTTSSAETNMPDVIQPLSYSERVLQTKQTATINGNGCDATKQATLHAGLNQLSSSTATTAYPHTGNFN